MCRQFITSSIPETYHPRIENIAIKKLKNAIMLSRMQEQHLTYLLGRIEFDKSNAENDINFATLELSRAYATSEVYDDERAQYNLKSAKERAIDVNVISIKFTNGRGAGASDVEIELAAAIKLYEKGLFHADELLTRSVQLLSSANADFAKGALSYNQFKAVNNLGAVALRAVFEQKDVNSENQFNDVYKTDLWNRGLGAIGKGLAVQIATLFGIEMTKFLGAEI